MITVIVEFQADWPLWGGEFQVFVCCGFHRRESFWMEMLYERDR